MLPFAIILTLIFRQMGKIVERMGARLPLTIGPICTGIGFLLFALTGITDGPSDYWWTFFPAIVMFGIGMGITVAPLTTAVMGSVAQHRAGIASGVNNAVTRTA